MGNWVVRGMMGVAAGLLLCGCSMRVPVQGADFSPEEKVIVTFDNGSSVTGRIDNGETIEYVTGKESFRGFVESVDEQEIVISDLVALADQSNHYEKERMQHLRLYVDDVDLDRLILNRDDILQVERITPDRGKTVRRILFWSFAAGVGALAARDRNF